jgi:hypothetical protein
LEAALLAAQQLTQQRLAGLIQYSALSQRLEAVAVAAQIRVECLIYQTELMAGLAVAHLVIRHLRG